MLRMQNTEFNSSFLCLLLLSTVLNPIILVVVKFYIFRIPVYKFCLRLTPQEKHYLTIHSPASFVSMILLNWLFLCGLDHINILLQVFGTNIQQSLNDRKKKRNFKINSREVAMTTCEPGCKSTTPENKTFCTQCCVV